MEGSKSANTYKEQVFHRITLIGRGETVHFECGAMESLLEVMTRYGIYISALCGGRGTCGKCKIKLLQGTLEITQSDPLSLAKEEINDGFRLACNSYPTSDCTIMLASSDEADFEVLANTAKLSEHTTTTKDRYAIAIDIGTTTIAVSLLEIYSGDILYTYTTVNKQRVYGADVITRMDASNNGKQKELKESIQKDLMLGIKAVVEITEIPRDRIERIAIAGNTTMGHLLLGYSCKTLGSFPFTPVNITTIMLTFEEVLYSDYLKLPVVLLPGISTFVGADIAAGLLACDYDRVDQINLFIDLGTNGEMAVGNRNKILVSSTAAGPAFEGGNISCGVGSIPGAICNFEISEKLSYRTIGDKAPLGICGTGVIELVAELLKNGIVDETGLLIEEYFINGYPIVTDPEGNKMMFTQRDIREIQLAKAAIRAGVEILIKRYAIEYEDINSLYLAGGFGYKMNTDKAIEIGLLPRELAGRIQAVGNSSLQGAVKYLTERGACERLEQIIQVTEEINLSVDKDFNDLYVGYMNF